MRNTRSHIRLLGFGLALALVSLMAGDRIRAQAAGDPGIDPLAVLDLQVKANAVVVLDSSGSMVWAPGWPSDGGVSDGKLTGDDPGSKLYQAKEVLKEVVTENDHKVKFKFGMYSQPRRLSDVFLYSTTNAAAASMSINSGGVSRSNNGSDNFVVNGVTHYYVRVRADSFKNGQTLRTDGAGANPGTKGNPPRFWIRTNSSSTACTDAQTRCIRFDFRGHRVYDTGGGSCSGFDGKTETTTCAVLDQYTGSIERFLAPELSFDANGDVIGYGDGSYITNPAGVTGGIRAAGATPISYALRDINGWFGGASGYSSFPTPKPRTFIIFVTDGDDTCAPVSSNTMDDDKERALAAAYRAQQLYKRRVSTERTSSVTTFVVAYGGGVSLNYANWIAWGGSGLREDEIGNNGTRWNDEPAADKVAACKARGECIDAFTANSMDELKKAIQSAIDQGSASGEFAASPTIAETVWEYGRDVRTPTYPSGIDPWNPQERYDAFVQIVFQPTFDASNFNGKFTAWGYNAADPDNPLQKWEAGDMLAGADSYASGPPGIYIPSASNPTFSDLRGTSLTNALIKRRIYTSATNGAFTTTALRTPIALWPPPTGVAPASDAAGTLDAALGIVGDGTNVEFAALQSEFGACKGANLTGVTAHPCNSSNLATRIARARRETREMVLAYTAGAMPKLDGKGYPLRCGGASVGGTESACTFNPASSTETGIIFQRRPWVLADSTLAAPAIVAPPLEIAPATHEDEYLRMRDGDGTGTPRLDSGLGLRHPDRGNSAWVSNPEMKPVMTVAYLATNAMLHAFRAGPCINATAGSSACSDGSVDTGGEELWAFVPFDQLGKLKELRQPPKRDPHTYMVASSIRIADVWDSYTSAWRTVLYFGRGAGGKSITALDVTAPGPATRSSLGAINAPLVLWNRGNPDTRYGRATDAINNTNADLDAYAKMGQTWSVPAVVKVNPDENTTSREKSGVEFVAYVGSGYSSVAGEGSSVYALDALTGDVVGYYDVGSRSGAAFPNAVVAAPAALAPTAFSDTPVHPADALATRVYVGDVHGRVWSFPTQGGNSFKPVGNTVFADLGANQPVANPVSILYYDSDATGIKPHVYVSTGNDTRVAPPGEAPPFAKTPPFRMYGLQDTGTGTATQLFAVDFPNDTAPGFRGTTSPAAVFSAFNGQRQGRVFFGGTQFTPAGTECVSQLDSVLFALTGRNGDAAFDLDSRTGDYDKYIVIPDQIITQVDIVRTPDDKGRLNISRGVGSGGRPPEPVKPPATGVNAAQVRQDVYSLEHRLSSSVCRR